MAVLQWDEDYQELIGTQASSYFVLSGSKFYAAFDNRNYFINQDESDPDTWVLHIFVAGHPAVVPSAFASVDAAKQFAEVHDRSARAAHGIHFAHVKGESDLATRRRFGDLFADKYSVQGVSDAQAWEAFKST